MRKRLHNPSTPEPRQCYYISVRQYDEHGFIPSLVTENEAGHRPMTGRGNGAAPWYWGKTLDRAEEVCARVNLQRFGINQDTAERIVASSIAATNREEYV